MASTKKKAGARLSSAPSPGKARGVKKANAAATTKKAAATTKKPAAATTKKSTAGGAKAVPAPQKKATPRAVAPRKATARKPPAGKAAPGAAAKARPKTDARKKAVAVIVEPAAPAKTRARRAAATAAVAPRRPRVSRARRAGAVSEEQAPLGVPGLNEEDQIRAAKYLPRELPKRLFEEDRFLFPETYGVNRVRLLVRDPEWIFAYWDVDPSALKDLARSLGERGLALSRLTLRVQDPVSGGSSDILLPPGARWWYIRTDSARRSYRAELGVTLPSGEFRRLAESNTVVTPRVGPSPQRARRRMSYRDASELPPSAAEAAGQAEIEAGLSREPWAAESVDASGAPGGPGSSGKAVRGGASDVFRPGGASDTFRR
jgi:hypothetical protein